MRNVEKHSTNSGLKLKNDFKVNKVKVNNLHQNNLWLEEKRGRVARTNPPGS